MKKIAYVLTLFVVLLFGLMACSKSSFSKSSSDKLKVVTTIFMDIDHRHERLLIEVGNDPFDTGSNMERTVWKASA